MTYTNTYLYDLILAERRRTGCSAQAACEVVAGRLKWADVGRDLGASLLARVEAELRQRRPFVVGHLTAATQFRHAPSVAADTQITPDQNGRDNQALAVGENHEDGRAMKAVATISVLPARPSWATGIEWDKFLFQEWAFATGRKVMVRSQRPDWRASANRNVRWGTSIVRRGELEGHIADAYKDDKEEMGDVLARTPTIQHTLKRLLGGG